MHVLARGYTVGNDHVFSGVHQRRRVSCNPDGNPGCDAIAHAKQGYNNTSPAECIVAAIQQQMSINDVGTANVATTPAKAATVWVASNLPVVTNSTPASNISQPHNNASGPSAAHSDERLKKPIHLLPAQATL